MTMNDIGFYQTPSANSGWIDITTNLRLEKAKARNRELLDDILSLDLKKE